MALIAIEKEHNALVERSVSAVCERTGLHEKDIAPFVLEQLKSTEPYRLLEDARIKVETFERLTKCRSHKWLQSNPTLNRIYKQLKDIAS